MSTSIPDTITLDTITVVLTVIGGVFAGLLVAIFVRLGVYASLTSWVIWFLQQLFLLKIGMVRDPAKGPFQSVVFRLRVEHARRVCLAGTFNEWLRASHIGGRIIADPRFALKKASADVWEITIRTLPPSSRHEYAFVLDFGTGYWQWLADPECKGRGHCGFSEVVVGEAS